MSSMKIANHLERRTKARFPLHRQMRYKVLHNNGTTLQSGNGQTLDISSTGIAFTVDRQVPDESYVELAISWPVLLHNDCPMQLIVFGRMLRSDESRTVCSIDKYEFRTRGRVLQPATDQSSSLPVQLIEPMQKTTVSPARPRVFQI